MPNALFLDRVEMPDVIDCGRLPAKRHFGSCPIDLEIDADRFPLAAYHPARRNHQPGERQSIGDEKYFRINPQALAIQPRRFSNPSN
jgi:hypothetical protein